VSVALVSNPDCGRHDTGWGHPEHVGRLRAVTAALREKRHRPGYRTRLAFRTPFAAVTGRCPPVRAAAGDHVVHRDSRHLLPLP